MYCFLQATYCRDTQIAELTCVCARVCMCVCVCVCLSLCVCVIIAALYVFQLSRNFQAISIKVPNWSRLMESYGISVRAHTPHEVSSNSSMEILDPNYFSKMSYWTQLPSLLSTWGWCEEWLGMSKKKCHPLSLAVQTLFFQLWFCHNASQRTHTADCGGSVILFREGHYLLILIFAGVRRQTLASPQHAPSLPLSLPLPLPLSLLPPL